MGGRLIRVRRRGDRWQPGAACLSQQLEQCALLHCYTASLGWPAQPNNWNNPHFSLYFFKQVSILQLCKGRLINQNPHVTRSITCGIGFVSNSGLLMALLHNVQTIPSAMDRLTTKMDNNSSWNIIISISRAKLIF